MEINRVQTPPAYTPSVMSTRKAKVNDPSKVKEEKPAADASAILTQPEQEYFQQLFPEANVRGHQAYTSHGPSRTVVTGTLVDRKG